MKRLIALMLALSLGTVFSTGCDREKKVEKKETVTSPGGTTTTTKTDKVESSGDNPPASSTGDAVPKENNK